MRLALSTLCENATRKTGLTTLFEQFVDRSAQLYGDLRWIVFTAKDYPWNGPERNVEVIKIGCSTQDVKRRMWCDHLVVPGMARELGAAALVTAGFVPLRKSLPVVAHIVTLQHEERVNGVGELRSAYRSLMVRRAASRADLVIANSNWAAGQLLRSYPSLGSRMLTSYEGLDHSRFCAANEAGEPERLRAGLGLSPGYLLWVSNFYSYKQADGLIRAFALMDCSFRKKFPLVMVGGGWDHGAESALELATALGVAPEVKFLGWVAEEWLAPLYRNAAAFCHPSRSETFGRSVVEAMACGLPCLVNDIPVMREISGGHASFVDFGDPEASAAALRAICLDGRLREDLRRKGIEQASRYSFDVLARERIQAISDMIHRALPVSKGGNPSPDRQLWRRAFRGCVGRD